MSKSRKALSRKKKVVPKTPISENTNKISFLSTNTSKETPRKGNENSLHLQLKEALAEDGDIIEGSFGNFKADILRENLLIEIQTQSLSSIKKKITQILKTNPLRVVIPIHIRKHIIKLSEHGEYLHKRRSPKKENIYTIFNELIYVPHLILDPNFQLEIISIESEEVRMDDQKGSRHRGRLSIVERGLVKIHDRRIFTNVDDFCELIPKSLWNSFTTSQLAEKVNIRIYIARKMAYTFFKAGMTKRIGKIGNAHIYKIEMNKK